MRILFLTPQQLDEPNSGGTIKSAALLSYLEREHEVDAAAFRAPDAEPWRRANGGTVTVPIERERSSLNLARSYAARLPLSIQRNRSGEMRERVERLLAEIDPLRTEDSKPLFPFDHARAVAIRPGDRVEILGEVETTANERLTDYRSAASILAPVGVPVLRVRRAPDPERVRVADDAGDAAPSSRSAAEPPNDAVQELKGR